MNNITFKKIRDPKTRRLRYDLTGITFGNLTVLNQAPDYVYGNTVKKKAIMWHCKCKCGKELNVTQDKLLAGKMTSCGCMNSNAFKDMTGQKIGKLTVISRAEDYKYKGGSDVQWLCKCECGNKIIIKGSSLRKRKVLSCGCDKSNTKFFKHGLANTPAYNTYNNMKRKALNKNIPVYDKWLNENTGVIEFCKWANANGIDKGKSLIMIDESKGYFPDNCKIIDTNIITITLNGETHTIYEWEKIKGVEAHVIYNRLKKGVTPEEALAPSTKYVKTITDSNGITKTVKEWAQEVGKSPYVLYNRANNNWEPDRLLYQALTRTGGPGYITYNGNIFTQSQWEYVFGLRPGTIASRIYQGMIPEEALTYRGSIPINGIYFIDANGNPIAQDEMQ